MDNKIYEPIATEDIFRQEYKPLTEEQKEAIKNVKEAAAVLNRLLLTAHTNHPAYNEGLYEFNNAASRLQECVMWATKGITK